MYVYVVSYNIYTHLLEPSIQVILGTNWQGGQQASSALANK